MASKVGSGPPPPPPAPVVAATATAGPGPAAAAAASPSPSLSASAAPSLSVECCMCGDHGLARELFRCRSCHHRYQHKYCSDLYPKADSYRSCNWCLRDGGTPAAAATTGLTAKSSAKHNHHHHSTATPSSAHHSPSSSTKDHHPHQPAADRANNNNNSHSLSSSTSTADNNSTGSSAAGTGAAPATSPVKQLQRGGDYAAHLLAKPLKKIRPAALERSASEVIVRVRAAEEMGAPAAAVAARRVAGGRHAAVRGKIRRYKLLEEVSS